MPVNFTTHTALHAADKAAQKYCNKLQNQNSGEQDVAIMMYFGRTIAGVLFWFVGVSLHIWMHSLLLLCTRQVVFKVCHPLLQEVLLLLGQLSSKN